MKYYPLKNLLGVVVHEWDVVPHPDLAVRAPRFRAAIVNTKFKALRIYRDAAANKDPQNLTYRFSPDGRGIHIDKEITELRKIMPDLTVLLCYQNMPENIQKLWQAAGKRSTQYRRPGTDLNDFNTWKEMAKDMAIITARYGRNANVPDYPLFVSPNWWENKPPNQQEMLKGTGLVDIVEGGNEWDNEWSNVNGTTGELDSTKRALTGYQYAPAWKVMYEAVKAIDPTMIVSTTGVMTENPATLIEALDWEQKNNGGKPIFDEYQFHCYPWGWAKDIANAMPPEYNMVPAAKKVAQAAGERGTNIGEWGFDLHRDSTIGLRPPVGYDGETYRGYLIARALFGFAAVGTKRAFYYREFQDNGLIHDNNPTIFETSSLFIKDGDDNITRRFGGDVYRQFADNFENFYFDSELVAFNQAGEPRQVYKFTDGPRTLIIGWTVEQVELVTEPNGQWSTNRAKLTEIKSSYTFPAGTRLEFQPGDSMKSSPFAGGSIELTSKPVMILVNGTATEPPPPAKAVMRKGYWVINSKRRYWVVYTDWTLVETDKYYKPL